MYNIPGDQKQLRHLMQKKFKAEKRLEQSQLDEQSKVNMTEKLADLFRGECPETEADIVRETADEGASPEELEELITAINAEIAKAKLHVDMHTSQRALAKMYIEIAVRDEENGVVLSV